jgi:hypothetical protein
MHWHHNEGTTMNYDQLHTAVNARYQELGDQRTDRIEILRKEFSVSTSVIWEIVGISDQLESFESDDQ